MCRPFGARFRVLCASSEAPTRFVSLEHDQHEHYVYFLGELLLCRPIIELLL